MSEKVLIYAAVGISYPSDHYGICRNEGRIPTNIGFGLKELGYDVNIVHCNFKDLHFINNDGNKGRVTLSKEPIYDRYDFGLSWGAMPGNIPCKKEINFINYQHEVNGIKRLACTFVVPYKDLVDYMTRESKRPVEYLPPLYPIPTYTEKSNKLGFKDFNYEPKDNTLKLFVYISSWERLVFCFREFEIIISRIKFLVNNKGMKLKLYIQIDSENTKREIRNILKLADEFEYIGKLNYDEYLRMIESLDMFLLKGNQFMASAGMYDIIALGKPMLYVSEELHNGIYRNPLFKNSNEIIFARDNELSIKRKIDDIIKNPERLYNIFRNTLSDSDFNNWKQYATKIFSL